MPKQGSIGRLGIGLDVKASPVNHDCACILRCLPPGGVDGQFIRLIGVLIDMRSFFCCLVGLEKFNNISFDDHDGSDPSGRDCLGREIFMPLVNRDSERIPRGFRRGW
jgi:hypothetical protein